MELHWLPVRAWIEFKIILITFKVIKRLPPKYLSVLIVVPPFSSDDLRRNNNGILSARSTLYNPRTYTQILIPTEYRREGVDGTPSKSF